MSSKPFLLYAYPWMPFPRRVIIYLRERGIPTSLVTVVPVSDPQAGNKAAPGFPPRPSGSLPILSIPQDNKETPFVHIRQSLAIIRYLEDLCDAGSQGFPKPRHSLYGSNPLDRARVNELLALSDELTVSWNPVRTFGTAAGTMSLPEASQEMIRWTYRTLLTIETWFKDEDFTELRQGGTRSPNIAEILLYQFLEFTKDCYGKDMTVGSGQKVVDVYHREVVEDFSKLAEFYTAFSTRSSAVRDPSLGEIAGPETLKAMQTWYW